MIRTPCVLRPMRRISLARMRWSLAAGGHHQHLVVVVDADDGDHRAVAIGGLDVAHAHPAATLGRVALPDELCSSTSSPAPRRSIRHAASIRLDPSPRIASLGVSASVRLSGLLGPNGVRLP